VIQLNEDDNLQWLTNRVPRIYLGSLVAAVLMGLAVTAVFFPFAPLWAVLGAFAIMILGFFGALWNQLIFKVGISNEGIVLRRILGKRGIRKSEVVSFEIDPPVAGSGSKKPWYMEYHRLTLHLTRNREMILANIEGHILAKIEEVLLRNEQSEF